MSSGSSLPSLFVIFIADVFVIISLLGVFNSIIFNSIFLFYLLCVFKQFLYKLSILLNACFVKCFFIKYIHIVNIQKYILALYYEVKLKVVFVLLLVNNINYRNFFLIKTLC